MTRVNHKIRVPPVRLIDAKGDMIGVVTISEAMSMAVRSGKDLVEVSPNADPPVCRIMDYGKFKYEQSRKDRDARKHQHAAEMKEMKFHANVGEHDFATKVNHIRGFLEEGIKVKCSLFFRGRENAHRELGFAVMQNVLKGCESLSSVDMTPKLIGNSIVMVISPRTGKPVGHKETLAGAMPAPAVPGAVKPVVNPAAGLPPVAKAAVPVAPVPAAAASPVKPVVPVAVVSTATPT